MRNQYPLQDKSQIGGQAKLPKPWLANSIGKPVSMHPHPSQNNV